MPPVSLDTFRNVANNAVITSRDIEIHGKGANATARLGAYVFSAGKKANDATMAAFKAALEKEYGVFGTHAFDTVLGARSQMHKSRMLSPELRQKIRTAIASEPFKGVDPKACKSQADIAHMAVKRLNDAIHDKRTGERGEDITLDGRKKVEQEAGSREPTGLRNLKKVFDDKETSVEDRIKKGVLGSGMRVNRSDTNPVLLDKLKTNGVEPGFILTPRRAGRRWTSSRRRIPTWRPDARARACASRSCSRAGRIRPGWPRRRSSCWRRRCGWRCSRIA